MHTISLYTNILALQSHDPSWETSAAEQSRVHKIFEHITSYHSSSAFDRSPSPTILEYLEQAEQINLKRYYALRDEHMLEFDFDERVHNPCCRLIAGFHQAHHIYSQGHGAFMAAWEDKALILQGRRYALPHFHHSDSHSSRLNVNPAGSMLAPFASFSDGPSFEID